MYRNKDWLYNKYVVNKLGAPQIAKICQCSHTTIYKYLKIFNISTRSNPDAIRNRWGYDIKKEDLIKLYSDKKLSLAKVAKCYGCDVKTIVKYMDKYNITMRNYSESQQGELSRNWKGGISNRMYCYKFNDNIKEDIRISFNRRCFICGKSESANGRKLDVHHITYGKMDGCNGQRINLIPLCKSCHAKTGFLRYYWFNLLYNYWVNKYIQFWGYPYV